MYNPNDFTMEGQVAIVTGAGAGIGRAIAETFAAAGAAVMVSDLHLDTASAVCDAINTSGGKAAAAACDVTNEDDLARIIAETVENFGKLTHLVSNAGGGGPKPFDMPIAEFKRAFDLNVFSMFRLAQLAAPEIEKAGGGAMLGITSMAAENKNVRMAAYGASKAATSHLIRNIAFDLGPRGIRVNGIAPGATRTDALKSVLNDEIEAKMLKHTPIHRLGEPQDMANAALFLCSPASSWVSGQIITVSGGGVQELDKQSHTSVAIAPESRVPPSLLDDEGAKAVQQLMEMTTALNYSEDYADPNAEVWTYAKDGSPLPFPKGY